MPDPAADPRPQLAPKTLEGLAALACVACCAGPVLIVAGVVGVVAGSIAWGMVADGYRPDRYDVIGALVCLAGMAVIMYVPRSH